jgi:ketosteroid isomerase-like protein
MPVPEQDRNTVERLFKAMQMGPPGEEAMMALFDENAVFIEPFSGQVQTHTGKPAIRESFRQMWKEPLPDLQLSLDQVELDGDTVRAAWTCASQAFPMPMRGFDLLRIRAGKIMRLEIVVTEMPPPPPSQSV